MLCHSQSHNILTAFNQVSLYISKFPTAARFWNKALCSTSLSTLVSTLSANCSVLLLSVALSSSKTSAPCRFYHKEQKEERLYVCVFSDGWRGGIAMSCVCAWDCSVEKLCKACWPTGDELHNGHYGNRLSRRNPSSTPRVPQLLEHRAACVHECMCVC